MMLLSQPLFTDKIQRSGHLKTRLKIQEEGALEPSGCTEGRAERSAQSRQLSVFTDNSIPTPLYPTLPELVHSGTNSAERVDLALVQYLRMPTPSYLVSAGAAIFLNKFQKDKLP